MFIVYRLTNKVNGKSYVGVTSRTMEIRLAEHQYAAKTGAQQALPRAIRKYGIFNFLVETLEEGWDERIGVEIREPYWISVLDPEYNQTSGGEGAPGYRWSEEYRKTKIQELLGNQNAKGFRHSEKQKHNKSERMKKIPMKVFVCPHCFASGNMVIKRYHFDHCERWLTK